MEESSTGDMDVDIECDIELYYTEEISNNKVYFHIGDPFNAIAADKIAYIDGSFSTNNGMYLGINFTGTGKDESSFEKDGGGNYTGVITDGMVSDRDSWRPQTNSFDVEILMNWFDGSGWQTFTQTDLELLTGMAQQIAVALENAKLYQRLQAKFKLTEKELKKTQEKLIRSERLSAMGNLVQGVAHEIRNPIMTIGGFARRA